MEEKKQKSIKPELAGGFRDYLPAQATERNAMFTTLKNAFERFGFVPLETPGVERYEVLTGGDKDFDKQLYRLVSGDGEKTENLALRFDLTVPLARVVAANASTLALPFKRYQIGSVWRGERQQAGRYKEFMQCDVDIVGSKRMEADAEIVALLYTVMKELGVEEFLIRVNNRKLLNALPAYAKFDKKFIADVLRALDKYDKQGFEEVKKELSSKPISLDATAIKAIETFINIKGKDASDTLNKLEKAFDGILDATEGIGELKQILQNLKALGVPKEAWEIDVSVARGLSYYTGPVFETFVKGFEDIGSVASGGRYDGLMERFGAGEIPAVGVSVGIDRLYAVLQEKNKQQTGSVSADVLVLNFNDTCVSDVQRLVGQLRANKISAELYVGQEKSLKGQISYGVKKGFGALCIIGDDEKKREVVQIKNIASRQQKEVMFDDVVAEVKKLLAD